MKKTTKILFSVLLSAVMLVMSVVPAFAATNDITYMEDHSVVDCTHYYKENGNYYFQIKCPKGQLDNVSVQLTKKADGTASYHYVQFRYSSFENGLFGKEHAYSDDTYDYTWLIVKYGDDRFSYPYDSDGVGVQIFYHESDSSVIYTATNTANYSTTRGNGYFLSKY